MWAARPWDTRVPARDTLLLLAHAARPGAAEPSASTSHCISHSPSLDQEECPVVPVTALSRWSTDRCARHATRERSRRLLTR